jgi:hypothetical protein
MNLRILIVPCALVVFLPALAQKAWIRHNGNFYNVASAEFPYGLSKISDDHNENRYSRQLPGYQNPSLKAGQTIKQVLDSMVWEIWDDTAGQWMFAEKMEHTYDDEGNVISFGWCDGRHDSITNQCEYNIRWWYTNDVIGKKTISQKYMWVDLIDQWVVRFERGTYNDLNGKVTYYIDYSSDSTGQSKPFSKHVWFYDSTGRETLAFHYWYWEDPGRWKLDRGGKYTYVDSGNVTIIYAEGCYNDSLWRPSAKFVNIYNSSGKMIQYLRYYYKDSATLEGIENLEWKYDSNGNMTQRIKYRWDEEVTSQWRSSDKKEFTYEKNGNLIRYQGFRWNKNTSQWEIGLKEEYDYDVNGNIIRYRNYCWWDDDSYKEEFTYDDNGNVIQSIYWYWNEITNQWVIRTKMEYTYDANYLFGEVSFPFIFNALFHHPGESIVPRLTRIFDHLASSLAPDDTLDVLKRYKKDLLVNNKLTSSLRYEGDTLRPVLKCMFYYSDLGRTPVIDLETELVEIYPNPVINYLSFRFKGNHRRVVFELYNIRGQKILLQEISNNKSLYLENLQSGVYIYGLNIDGTWQRGKLIKQ